MLLRAEARGELRSDLDKELFLDGMFGALFAHVVFQNQPITPAFTQRLLDHLMRVATPVKPSRPRSVVRRVARALHRVGATIGAAVRRVSPSGRASG